MRFSASTLFALATGAAAQSRGFNYGALDLDGSPRTLQDFTDQFNAAKALPGTNGQFTSARLFTMLQAGAANTVISAIQAAIDTDTTLLLGLWASQAQDGFNAELGALQSAIDQYGDDFTSRVVGISVGSEDLYRISPTGIENESGIGQSPDTVASYIGQVRELIAGGPLANAPIGHVDTWTAWVNGSNSAVINAVDWLGVDAYPYFQNTEANGIENGESLFFAAYDATVGAAAGKPVWITETGWPVEGPDSNLAQAGAENAQTYWRDVACRVLGTDTNLWWFTLDDDQATSDDVSFSLVNPTDLFGQPLFDLSCDAAESTSSAPASTSSAAPSTSSVPVSSAAPSSYSSFSVPPSASTEIVSIDPIIPASEQPAITTFVTEPAATAATEPGVVTQTSVVVAPAPTTQAEESAAPAATAESTTPLPFDGGAARVAGGAAAGVAAVFAFFL